MKWELQQVCVIQAWKSKLLKLYNLVQVFTVYIRLMGILASTVLMSPANFEDQPADYFLTTSTSM